MPRSNLTLKTKTSKHRSTYYTRSKTRLTENVFPLTSTLALTLTETLKHINVFRLTKWRHWQNL